MGLLLRVRGLSVRVGDVPIVDLDELMLRRGRHLAIVGESGSGKTMTAMSLVGLQPSDAVVSGSATFADNELIGRSERQWRTVRGVHIGVIFQDPQRALNPMMRVGRQVEETLKLHQNLSRGERKARAISLLERVRLPDPAAIARRYPHQLSGGQRQRVLIATAIACDPQLLIADEPTTALDVTVQIEILQLLKDLSATAGMSVVLVSHDLGVVQSLCDDVAVMYGGQIVESGATGTVIATPRHRYTKALLDANPRLDSPGPAMTNQPLRSIPGTVPAAGRFPDGCPFRGRCDAEVPDCALPPPSIAGDDGHTFYCWNPITYESPAMPAEEHR